MSADKDASASAPPKYARYRNVKSASSLKAQEPGKNNELEDTVQRSRSRYRHQAAPTTEGKTLPPVPRPAAPIQDAIRRATEPISSQGASGGEGRGRQTRGYSQETEAERLRRQRQEAKDHENVERRQLQKEAELRLEREAESERARLEEQTASKLLQDQKRKDLQRLDAELAAAAAPVSPAPSSKDKFSGFFSRKRAPTATTKSSNSGPGTRTSSTDLTQGIQQGGGGIVPGTDAPVSAVNAGERRVLIRCQQSSINLPITPETTPADLIHSAANVMTQEIIPSTAILLESYGKLGLERRIRRYEHIRDVMNSWDRDTQNALIIQHLPSPSVGRDLESYAAPKEAPPDVTVYMYHSQKPGKWNKRYITLLSSGQVYVAKKYGAKLSDKDVTSICHLSDFDIYSPTPQQARKNLKPPKKYCQAVRSQQKTAMFLSTENFVHFFSSDDVDEIERWYSAVQSWRSWYLVNKMGEGQHTRTKTMKTVVAKTPSRPGTKGGQTHKVKVSVDEDPYTLGSFKPLLNLDRFAAPAPVDPTNDSDDENRPLQIPSHLRGDSTAKSQPTRRESKKYPPVSYQPPQEEEFPTTSLLGRTYSQRQRAQKESSGTSNNVPSAAPIRSASQHRRTSSMTSQSARPGSSAGPGKREMAKPLLDFTPQFEEPPQWSSKGKGKGIAPKEGLTLVEIASGPDPIVEGVGGTVFRRDAAVGRPKG